MNEDQWRQLGTRWMRGLWQVLKTNGMYPWVVVNSYGLICGHFKTLEEAKQFVNQFFQPDLTNYE